MQTDTSILEIHRVKEELMNRDNHDIAAMVSDTRARQGQSGKNVVDRSGKEPIFSTCYSPRPIHSDT